MLDLKTTTSISKLKYIEILKILVQKLKKVKKKTNKKNDAYFANCKFRTNEAIYNYNTLQANAESA